MTEDWKNYQEETATFFRSLGFNAKVEEIVEGARGKHKIDVWVVGCVYGVSFQWVVECKHWKRNIPKEKVMALISIVQDLGADRGFLLSEVGFQSGAIQSVNKSNITLTNIADLYNEASESSMKIATSSLFLKIAHLKHQIYQLRIRSSLRYLGQLTMLEHALSDALEKIFPTVYTFSEKNVPLTVSNWKDLLNKAVDLLQIVENYIESNARKKIEHA